ncbi:hypothetical protein BGX27_001784 [Mortierella sp. AM989]|nr:hypothetical protein BGX27_001784 [Mortierella sp. AM989]
MPTETVAFGPYTNLTQTGPNFSVWNPIILETYADIFYLIHSNKENTEDWMFSVDISNPSKIGAMSHNMLNSPIPRNVTVKKTMAWEAMGGHNGGPAFALVQRIDPVDRPFLSALNLNGPAIAQWQYIDYNIKVTDSLGVDPSIPTGTPSPQDISPPSSGSSAGLIVGCIVGALAIICSTGWFLYRRRVKKLTVSESDSKQEQSIPTTHSAVPPQLGRFWMDSSEQGSGKIIVSPEPLVKGEYLPQQVNYTYAPYHLGVTTNTADYIQTHSNIVPGAPQTHNVYPSMTMPPITHATQGQQQPHVSVQQHPGFSTAVPGAAQSSNESAAGTSNIRSPQTLEIASGHLSLEQNNRSPQYVDNATDPIPLVNSSNVENVCRDPNTATVQTPSTNGPPVPMHSRPVQR